MKKNIVLLLFLILAGTAGMAQDNVFTVMAVQGNVVYNGEILTPGQQLDADASVTVNANSYAGLLHRSGKSLELKTKGNYALQAYHDKLAVANKGFQEKYVEYVANGIATGSKSYKQNMAVTGSVERGFLVNDIVIPVPSKTVLMDRKFVVEWADNSRNAGQYEIVLRNMQEDVIFHSMSPDQNITIDLNAIDLEEQQYYLLTVTDRATNRVSNIANLYIPSGGERTALNRELSDVRRSLDMNTAVGQLAYAEILKSKGLYLDALHAHNQARVLSPDVEYYSGAYNNYVVTVADEE